MATNLAPVYLDDARVQLQGDPRPKVSKIVAAGGRQVADDAQVVRLREQGDEDGTPVRLEDVIDRAEGSHPVYLRVRGEGASLASDESTGFGTAHAPQQAFGAARPGMAGQGAQGSPGDVPDDKRAKSDFGRDERSGGSGETYGAGDLQPGGRTGLGSRPARQGEGLEAPYTDEGVGSTGRRQAGRKAASGVTAPEQGAQGGAIRDASTDSRGRQQGQPRGIPEREWSPEAKRSREGDGAVASEPSD